MRFHRNAHKNIWKGLGVPTGMDGGGLAQGAHAGASVRYVCTLLCWTYRCTYIQYTETATPTVGPSCGGTLGKLPPSATLASVKVALVRFCLVDPSAFRAGLRLGAKAVDKDRGGVYVQYESADTAPSGISPQPHAYLRCAHER